MSKLRHVQYIMYNILMLVTSLRQCSNIRSIKDLATKVHGSIFAVLTKKCRVGQGVKTPPFHGGITGSNPVRGTLLKAERPSCIEFQAVFLFQSINIVTKVAETVSF